MATSTWQKWSSSDAIVKTCCSFKTSEQVLVIQEHIVEHK